ncbi:MAG TPA: hypothetical protein VLG13_02195 [Patescibacteria group bacterium]|nr:hypothetical protein [Patescibacteria group bacterium]
MIRSKTALEVLFFLPMKSSGIPAAEQLRATEKLAHFAHIVGDCMLRAMPCLSNLPPAESSYHMVREQIKELETIANDPVEHR